MLPLGRLQECQRRCVFSEGWSESHSSLEHQYQGGFLKGIRAEAADRVVTKIVRLAKSEKQQHNIGLKEALLNILAEQRHDIGYYMYIVVQS